MVKVSSDSGVKLEQTAQSVATVNGPEFRRYIYRREEEKIAFSLVVALKMMMFDVLSQRVTGHDISPRYSRDNSLLVGQISRRCDVESGQGLSLSASGIRVAKGGNLNARQNQPCGLRV